MAILPLSVLFVCFLLQTVSSLLSDSDKKVCGVVLEDGTEIRSKAVLSNATPKVTFVDLLPTGLIPAELVQDLKGFDSTSPVTKINGKLEERFQV